MTLNELKHMLRRSHIHFSFWGTTSKTKPLKSLLKEIEERETILEETARGLIRYCSIVYIWVNHGDNVLAEEKSVWKDGRPPRVRDLPGSVSEKMKQDEHPLDAAVRGIKEELGLIIAANRFAFGGKTNSEEDSSSYPGLITNSTKYSFSFELTDKEYNPDGYIEDSEDKITYFIWK